MKLQSHFSNLSSLSPRGQVSLVFSLSKWFFKSDDHYILSPTALELCSLPPASSPSNLFQIPIETRLPSAVLLPFRTSLYTYNLKAKFLCLNTKTPIDWPHPAFWYSLRTPFVLHNEITSTSLLTNKTTSQSVPVKPKPLSKPHSLDSVQFSYSVVSNSLQLHGLQNASLPCISPTFRASSNSCPSSQWGHPTISSSVVSFSSPLQSFPASGSFPMSHFFISGSQNIGASTSASIFTMNIQDWFPLGWTGWISLQSKGLSRVVSNTTVQKH